MLQVLVTVSLKFCCRKEAWGYAKVIHKKRERKKLRKNRQVSKISKNNGYLDARLKKKEINKIAPVL
jgi:hypothetical protein